MALPPTGSAITMTNINNYFVSEGNPSSLTLGVLGTYLGISQGTTITMSEAFGGQGT